MRKIRLLLFLYIIAPLILIPYWAYLNGSILMLFGTITWFLGGWLFLTELGLFILISGLFMIFYFIGFGQAFSFHDDLLTIYLSMAAGYLGARLLGQLKEKERRKQNTDYILDE